MVQNIRYPEEVCCDYIDQAVRREACHAKYRQKEKAVELFQRADNLCRRAVVIREVAIGLLGDCLIQAEGNAKQKGII